MRLVLLVTGALVLVVGIGVSAWSAYQAGAERNWVSLASRMPMAIGGWEGKDLPLGETEAVRSEVGKLNFYDYLYRVYRKDDHEVYLYAMYWRQGDISVREMAGHTPDGCWVANGAKHALPQRSISVHIGGRDSKPAEVREFIFPNGVHVHTAWWHIWGSNIVDRSFAEKSLMPMIKEIWTWVGMRRGVPQDQLLIRVHSTASLDDIKSTTPMVVFLDLFPEVFSATPLYVQ